MPKNEPLFWINGCCRLNRWYHALQRRCRSISNALMLFLSLSFRHQGKEYLEKDRWEWSRWCLVGVGGAVLRDQTNELLIIKERVRNREFWKVKTMCDENWPSHFFVASRRSVSLSEPRDYLFGFSGSTELSEDIGKLAPLALSIELISGSRWWRYPRSVRRNGNSIQYVASTLLNLPCSSIRVSIGDWIPSNSSSSGFALSLPFDQWSNHLKSRWTRSIRSLLHLSIICSIGRDQHGSNWSSRLPMGAFAGRRGFAKSHFTTCC